MELQELEKLEKKINANAEQIQSNLHHIEENLNKINDNADKIQKNTLALEILRDYKQAFITLQRDKKILIALLVIMIVIWIGTMLLFHL